MKSTYLRIYAWDKLFKGLTIRGMILHRHYSLDFLKPWDFRWFQLKLRHTRNPKVWSEVRWLMSFSQWLIKRGPPPKLKNQQVPDDPVHDESWYTKPAADPQNDLAQSSSLRCDFKCIASKLNTDSVPELSCGTIYRTPLWLGIKHNEASL